MTNRNEMTKAPTGQMGARQMELADVSKAVSELKARVSPRADVYFSIDAGSRVTIYANGIVHERTFSVASDPGDTFASLLAKANAAWDGFFDQHRAETIRKMALAIIEITASLGRCSDAALRMKFPAEDIALYGKEAVTDANEIAANGPFEIQFSDSGNGAPDEIEEDEDA